MNIRIVKMLVVTVSFLFPNLFTQAQVSITSEQNLPIIGDKVYLQTVTGVQSGTDGANVLWDFSDCDFLKKEKLVRFALDSLGFKSSAPGLRKFYLRSGDTLFIRAYQSNMETMTYSHPPVVMAYPFSYGDSISSSFQGKGIFCGKYHVSHDGVSTVKADALGAVLLPDNKLLTDVLRIHSMTTKRVLLEGMEPNLIDSAKAKVEVVEDFYWYANGCRYPILEYHIGTSFDNGAKVASDTTAYCCLPDSVMDKAKSYISDNYWKFKTSAEPVGNSKIDNLIKYDLSQENNILRLSYSTTIKGTVSFVIASTMGMVYQSKAYVCQPDAECQVEFNCNGYQPGGYVVYISINGVVTSEKFQVK